MTHHTHTKHNSHTTHTTTHTRIVHLRARTASVRLEPKPTMGKLVWPAALALAHKLLEPEPGLALLQRRATAAAAVPPPQPTLVEVGAGAGLVALVASGAAQFAEPSRAISPLSPPPRALAGVFGLCIATEVTEAGVELLERNAAANGASALRCARLDVTKGGAAALAALVPLEEMPLVLCACDLHYDEEVVGALAETFAVLRGGARRDGADDALIISRSANFDHLDSALIRAAHTHGLVVEQTCEQRVPGSLLEELAVGPPVDDLCRIFVLRRA